MAATETTQTVCLTLMLLLWTISTFIQIISVVYIQIDAFDLNGPKLDNILKLSIQKIKEIIMNKKKDQQRNEDMD